MIEDFHRNAQAAEPKGASDRSFGLTFAIVFALASLWPFMRSHGFRMWPLPIAVVFLILAIFRPSTLHRLNVLWLKFGTLLSRIVNPIALGILFFGLFAPMGLLKRALGKDSLRLKWNKDDPSYWIERGPAKDASMLKQF